MKNNPDRLPESEGKSRQNSIKRGAKSRTIKDSAYEVPSNEAKLSFKQIKNIKRGLNRIGSNKKTKETLCFWPWQQLFIDYVSGMVKPHQNCLIEVGNIYKSSIKEIWNNQVMQSYRKNLIKNNYRDWCNPKCFAEMQITENQIELEQEG